MQAKSNTSQLFCGYWQTNSKVYLEKQKTQNSQLDTKEEQN